MRSIFLLPAAGLLAAACGPTEEATAPEDGPNLEAPPELIDPVIDDPVDDPGMMPPSEMPDEEGERPADQPPMEAGDPGDQSITPEEEPQ